MWCCRCFFCDDLCLMGGSIGVAFGKGGDTMKHLSSSSSSSSSLFDLEKGCLVLTCLLACYSGRCSWSFLT